MLDFLQLDLTGQRVLIRADLNVPLDDQGRVTSDARIRASVPTIRHALKAGATVAVTSHLGRPKDAKPNPKLSLFPVVQRLAELLEVPVHLRTDWLDGFTPVPAGEVALLENVRFFPGETRDDPELAARMAQLCDVFVMDAFGTAHRAQASTHGLALRAPVACAGPLLRAELAALGKAMHDPVPPVVAIVGGAKVSTKLELLEALIHRVDKLILGGGIANTFLLAAQQPIGRSLVETEWVATAARLLNMPGSKIPLPSDVRVASQFEPQAHATIRDIAEVTMDELILDIGPTTAAHYAKLIQTAGTIVWNGPVGVFEFENFALGTAALAQAIAGSSAYSIAAGGDTLAAVEKFRIGDRLSYISTGGGATLEFLQGKTLPAVAALQTRAAGLR